MLQEMQEKVKFTDVRRKQFLGQMSNQTNEGVIPTARSNDWSKITAFFRNDFIILLVNY